MGFHLVRGATEGEVFDAFRKWETHDDRKPPKLPNQLKCKLFPGSRKREKGSLQIAEFKASRDLSKYGDKYFLAVRCEGGWARDLEEIQRYAVAVEIRHQSEIKLYERIAERLKIQV